MQAHPAPAPETVPQASEQQPEHVIESKALDLKPTAIVPNISTPYTPNLN